MNKPSEEQAAAVGIVAAVGEAIRDLNKLRGGPIPSGELYANLCGLLNEASYTMVIDALVKAGMVKMTNHQLKWIGPEGRNYLEDLAEWERKAAAKRLAANPNSQDPSKWEPPAEDEED